MSEDHQPCVRGCVRPCDCEACQQADQPAHPPVPRTRSVGLLCERCVRHLEEWLSDIPDLYATLDPYLPYVSPQDPDRERGGRHQEITGSPALIRLDIASLADRRTSVTARITPGVEPEPWDGSIDVAGEMCSWALMLAEEHHLTSRVDTIVSACSLLATWLSTVAASPWVDECYDAIRQVHQLLRQANGVRSPRPIGRCPNLYERGGRIVECGHTLYKPDAGATIRCGSCGRRYDGYSLIVLGETLGVQA